jgi:hypothetical protein
MGATTFKTTRRGWTIAEAYDTAVEFAIEEYGNDPYNGTISTTRGVIDKTQLFKSSKLSIDEFIDKHIESCQKWGSAWGVCIEEPIQNKSKIKSKILNIVSKGTKKWELVYDVIIRGDVVKTFSSKTDAVKYGRDWVEKNKGRVSIEMRKKLVNGNTKVAEIEYKTDGKEKEGRYVFFGWAAE